MDKTAMGPSLGVLCRIRDIQRSVAAFEQAFTRVYGLSLNEGMVLCSLSQGEPLSAGQLGELLGLSASNASKVLAAAEHKGLVERSLGTTDRRQMYFSLTASGYALLAHIREGMRAGEVECPELLRPLAGGGCGTR